MIIASTKERLIKYLKIKKVSKADFYIQTGIKRGFLDTDKLKGTVTDVFLAKIIACFDDLSPVWLITGSSEMIIKNEIEKNIKPFNLRTDNNVDNQLVPLYDLEASAGLVELFQNQDEMVVVDTIQIPNLPKCDGAVYVTGDSMYPLLKSGDIVAYKKITDFVSDIFWGEMYLISVEVAGEEFISVKYIQQSERGNEYIKLVSQNKHHQSKDVHLGKVRAMALIKASIRINSMG